MILVLSFILFCNFWGGFRILSDLCTAIRGWWGWLPRDTNIIKLNEDIAGLSNEQCVERSRQLNVALTACLTQLGENGRAARQKALHQEILVIKSMEPPDAPPQIEAGVAVDWRYTGPRPQYHIGGL